jgi:hypothetical protein
VCQEGLRSVKGNRWGQGDAGVRVISDCVVRKDIFEEVTFPFILSHFSLLST